MFSCVDTLKVYSRGDGQNWSSYSFSVVKEKRCSRHSVISRLWLLLLFYVKPATAYVLTSQTKAGSSSWKLCRGIGSAYQHSSDTKERHFLPPEETFVNELWGDGTLRRSLLGYAMTCFRQRGRQFSIVAASRLGKWSGRFSDYNKKQTIKKRLLISLTPPSEEGWTCWRPGNSKRLQRKCKLWLSLQGFSV